MTASTQPLSGRRILIVDDDPDILAGMDLAFRGVGAATDLHGDGESAWQSLRVAPPDLAVLDMMLPKASGLLLLERLQSLETRPPVVMVTANQGRRHQEYAKSLGVEAYLVKPVPLGRLLEVAASLIGRADRS
jgi:DNA-binding response OmpR family regulator